LSYGIIAERWTDCAWWKVVFHFFREDAVGKSRKLAPRAEHVLFFHNGFSRPDVNAC
jgi:hypothetical protein